MFRKSNSSEKRSKLEIIAEIVRIASGGSNKTRIVYLANLNFKMLDKYLSKLEETGFIKKSQNKDGQIVTTEKGIEYLRKFNVLKDITLHDMNLSAQGVS